MALLSTYESLLPGSSSNYMQFNGPDSGRYTCVFQAIDGHRGAVHEVRPDCRPGYSFVISGSARIHLVDGSVQAIGPGTCFVLDRDRVELMRTDAGARWIECSLCLRRGNAEAYRRLGVLREDQVAVEVGADPEIVAAYRRCFDLFRARKGAPEAQAEVVAAVTAIFAARGRAIAQRGDDLVTRAKRLLAERCDDRDEVAAIAAELGLGYHAFRRRFAQQTGEAPRAWQIRYRIGKAHELLQRHGIDEVAAMLGYPDRFAFSRQFKRVSGQTPGAVRKELVGV